MIKKLVTFNFDSFLNRIQLKKKYLDEIKNQLTWLETVKENVKKGNLPVISDLEANTKQRDIVMVSYIIHIKFSRTNTLAHVTDFEGNMKGFYSAGSFNLSGKRKTARFLVLKKFFKLLKKKFKLSLIHI